nr:PREDICTED: uncharacterized protein LOC100880025 [Megachile rotundata]XP_012153714.1 PREDICTED: uncharacterized protein LOC100880025 [Megachile rotundata]XP_012153715.1 PREDICTED: uncharacterized protein LOC100880025 [Megachile rotundata]XP_012153716.1 PREDICTED: uncharacterized protein LOC100880025 [Megachile rotundata]XP_012153717.1 PREDICTED: uncharacterized protein LOC100880025 [Megachile rotundata]XP_012153718.1 PREDICTED: uncharacterized protein LOC100880025 [Megachile rotundata]XP_01
MKKTGKGHWFNLALFIVSFITIGNAEKHKREIFREQLLPALGGKIPEEAFRTDRLALNRLNKEGITVPDGVILDARNVHKHSQHIQTMPEAIQVYLTQDGRYVPPEGRFQYNHPKTVDTTYVIRKPYSHHKHSNNHANNKHRNIPKSQAYSSFRQFVPPSKPGVYKPIITPSLFPNGDLLERIYVPTWNIQYDWDTVYQPFDDYIVNNIAFFNSHQIIADYQGFLNKFHDRSSRHIEVRSKDKNHNAPQTRDKEPKNPNTDSQTAFHQSPRVKGDSTRYTNLTEIPETGFTCDGRRGLFADVQTKCQVFHNCSGWSKTSSLCPAGTAFSEVKKRCEWWNTVQCK